MKKLIPIFSLALVMAACNTAPKPADSSSAAGTALQQVPSGSVDTTGLASYQAWKAQNELADAKNYQSTSPEQQAPQPRIARPQRVSHGSYPKSNSSQASSPAAPATGSGSTAQDGNGNMSGGQATSESSQTAKAPQKKGWSDKAKGAVIGGVVGAGAGAIIDKKNPVLGAVIGGVLGAGGGYVIGNKMDQKNGRF